MRMALTEGSTRPARGERGAARAASVPGGAEKSAVPDLIRDLCFCPRGPGAGAAAAEACNG